MSMIRPSIRMLALAAAAAVLSAATPSGASTPREDYDTDTICAAVEGAGTPIPGHTAADTARVKAGFEKRAVALGGSLGLAPEQVAMEIGRKRNFILARMRGPDAVEDRKQQVDQEKMTQVCPAFVMFKAMHDAGLGR